MFAWRTFLPKVTCLQSWLWTYTEKQQGVGVDLFVLADSVVGVDLFPVRRRFGKTIHHLLSSSIQEAR